MFIKKIFGKSIEPNCKYCMYLNETKDKQNFCSKSKEEPEMGKCKHFKYDPLKRQPTVLPPLPKYDKDDFSL